MGAGRALRCNWDVFWGAALKDHCHAGLVWNERTRSELREALQVIPKPPAWNLQCLTHLEPDEPDMQFTAFQVI